MRDDKKKALIAEYKNRKPEMGVICYRCLETDEKFFKASKDIPADMNSISFRLDSGFFPTCPRLLELWKKYGSQGFEITVAARHKYDDPTDDQMPCLEKLLAEQLDANPGATIIRR